MYERLYATWQRLRKANQSLLSTGTSCLPYSVGSFRNLAEVVPSSLNNIIDYKIAVPRKFTVNEQTFPEPEFVNLLRSPGIDIPARRGSTTILFDVTSRQATKAGGIDSWAP